MRNAPVLPHDRELGAFRGRGADNGAEGCPTPRSIARTGARVGLSWLGLSEQEFRVDKWNICLVQAAAICGSQLK